MEVVSELVLRVVSSVVATLVVLYVTGLFRSLSPLVISGSIVASVALGLSLGLWLKVRKLAVPGLRSWLRDRSMEDYSYRLLRDARRSFEVMGATGSSVFAQSGKFLNTLSEKYEQNRSFVTHVLLVAPDAHELIEYRKRSLGSEPHALDSFAIQSTITGARGPYLRP